MSSKAELLRLSQRLGQLRAQVPSRAEAFHRECERLNGQIGSAASWSGMLGRADAVRELEPRVTRLEARSRGLMTLLDSVASLIDRATGLMRRARELEDAETGNWLSDRVETARSGLETLGRNVATDDELEFAEHECETIGAEVTSLDAALELLLAAQRDKSLFRGSDFVAPWGAAEPELLQRLRRDGATDNWLEEVRDLLRPMAERRERPPPKDIPVIEEILRDLPAWDKHLGQPRSPEVQQLRERFTARRKSWQKEQDDAFVQLLEEAKQLNQLRRSAVWKIREARWNELSLDFELFAELQARPLELAEALNRLRDAEIATPEQYTAWIKGFSALIDELRSAIRDDRKRLQAKYGEDRRKVEALIAGLSVEPRMQAQGDQLSRLNQRHEQMTRQALPTQGAELLKSVRAMRDLRRELEQLKEIFDGESRDLREGIATLRKRGDELLQLGETLGIMLPQPMPDEQAFEGIAKPGDVDLENARNALRALEGLQDQAERRFLDTAMARIEELHASCGRIAGTLGLTDTASPPEPPTRPGDLAALPDLLRQWQGREQRLKQQITAEESRLSKELTTLKARLEALSADGLGRGQRLVLDDLLAQINGWQGERGEDDLGHLDELRSLVEEAQDQLDGIDAQRRRFQQRRDALGRRWAGGDGALIKQYFVAFYDRIDALIHTPDDVPWPAGMDEQQLVEAERLFQRVLSAAIMLDARNMRRCKQRFRILGERGNQPDLGKLADELEAVRCEERPPPRLRRRTLEKAQDHLFERV